MASRIFFKSPSGLLPLRTVSLCTRECGAASVQMSVGEDFCIIPCLCACAGPLQRDHSWHWISGAVPGDLHGISSCALTHVRHTQGTWAILSHPAQSCPILSCAILLPSDPLPLPGTLQAGSCFLLCSRSFAATLRQSALMAVTQNVLQVGKSTDTGFAVQSHSGPLSFRNRAQRAGD